MPTAHGGWLGAVGGIFLEGVDPTATAAYTSARTLRDLVMKDGTNCQSDGRTSATAVSQFTQTLADTSRQPRRAWRSGQVLSANGGGPEKRGGPAAGGFNRLVDRGSDRSAAGEQARQGFMVISERLDVWPEGAEPLMTPCMPDLLWGYWFASGAFKKKLKKNFFPPPPPPSKFDDKQLRLSFNNKATY